jgi:ribosomal protein S18 acetylase RimI-like enzyme
MSIPLQTHATDAAPRKTPDGVSASTHSGIVLRRPSRGDRRALEELVAHDGLFTREEVAVALELIDAALDDPQGDYRVLVAELEGARLAGYICYGPTPMTERTWDLYWIATHPEARGRGVARALVERMEEELRGLSARLIRVETSQQESYGAAHAFYERLGYPCAARLPAFYKPGDDLLILLKRL